MFWVPKGFAHGFIALENAPYFLYKKTDYYNKESEGVIRWNDPDLDIRWANVEQYLVSEKDQQAVVLKKLAEKLN